MTLMTKQLLKLSISILLTSFFFLSVFPANAAEEQAVFAGGCFWCLEHDLESLKGVNSVESGYSGGVMEKPTYRQVSAGNTGHQEAVKIIFNSSEISYKELLRNYWRNVDPFDGEGQFCDRGDSYRPVVFVKDLSQESDAKESFSLAAKELITSPSKIKIEIQEATEFWPAEGYHQNYAEENNLKYNFYRYSCGRDQRLEEVWGKRARSGQEWTNS